MSWSRVLAVPAIVTALQQTVGESVFVFPKPPQTVNAPALIVGRPAEVRYSAFAYGVDECDLPVTCVGPADGEEAVDALIAAVRASFPDPMLGGAVQSIIVDAERAWRNINLAGVDLLMADANLLIRM